MEPVSPTIQGVELAGLLWEPCASFDAGGTNRFAVEVATATPARGANAFAGGAPSVSSPNRFSEMYPVKGTELHDGLNAPNGWPALGVLPQ